FRICASCAEYDQGLTSGTITASRIQTASTMHPAAAIRLPPMYVFHCCLIRFSMMCPPFRLCALLPVCPPGLRIQPRAQQVRNKIYKDHHRPHKDREPQDERVIPVRDRSNKLPPESGYGENALHHKTSRQQGCRRRADIIDNREIRIFQRMRKYNLPPA